MSEMFFWTMATLGVSNKSEQATLEFYNTVDYFVVIDNISSIVVSMISIV